MGTHSTVKFYIRGKCMLSIYNQYDGYISGEGNEILNFLEDEKWRGNGFDDEVLLYVCYKKDGKAYHTYVTTEDDIQEFNYKIYETDEGLRFNVTQEVYNEEYEEMCLVTLLRYGTFDDFKKLVQTEYLRDLIFMGHCEEFSDETRKLYRKMNLEHLIEQAKLNKWDDLLEKSELKGEF